MHKPTLHKLQCYTTSFSSYHPNIPQYTVPSAVAVSVQPGTIPEQAEGRVGGSQVVAHSTRGNVYFFDLGQH